MATLADLEITDSNTTILSASFSSQYEIMGLWIHNLTNNPVDFSLFLDREGAGAKRKLFSTLGDGDTLLLELPSSFTLDNTSSLIGLCSAGGEVSLAVLGDRINRR